jgi:hypothetical protein
MDTFDSYKNYSVKLSIWYVPFSYYYYILNKLVVVVVVCVDM